MYFYIVEKNVIDNRREREKNVILKMKKSHSYALMILTITGLVINLNYWKTC